MSRPDFITRENFTSVPCGDRTGWTVGQLRDFLKQEGQPHNGLKADLCGRIERYLQLPQSPGRLLTPTRIVATPVTMEKLLATFSKPPRRTTAPLQKPAAPAPVQKPPAPVQKPPAPVQKPPAPAPVQKPAAPAPAGIITLDTDEYKRKVIDSLREGATILVYNPKQNALVPLIVEKIRRQKNAANVLTKDPNSGTSLDAPLVYVYLENVRGPKIPEKVIDDYKQKGSQEYTSRKLATRKEAPAPTIPAPAAPKPTAAPKPAATIKNVIDPATLDLIQDYLDNPLTPDEIDDRRSQIYNNALAKIENEDPNNIASLSDDDLFEIVNDYDQIFLGDSIATFFDENPHQEFTVRFGNTTGTAGECKFTSCDTVFQISKKLISGLFQEGGDKVETNAGVQCYDQLMCMLLTIEHELIHLLFERIVRSDVDDSENHGPRFRNFAKSAFGHTSYRHDLGLGLAEDPNVYRKKVQEYLKPGQLVDVKDPKKKVIKQYKVLEVFNKSNSVNFRAEDPVTGERWAMPLTRVILPGTEQPAIAEEEESAESTE